MKTITMKVYNKFLNQELMRFTFPYSPIKAMNGWYSNFWRKIRTDMANCESVEKHFIRVKFWLEPGKTDRMVLTMPSGAKMDAPFELNHIDCKIISLHLAGLELAISNR